MQAFHFYPLNFYSEGLRLGPGICMFNILPRWFCCWHSIYHTLRNTSVWTEGKLLKSGYEWFRGKETVRRNNPSAPFHPTPHLEEYNIQITLWAAYPVQPINYTKHSESTYIFRARSLLRKFPRGKLGKLNTHISLDDDKVLSLIFIVEPLP